MRTTPAIRAAEPAPPPEPFTVETVLTGDDRIAAASFGYGDVLAASRRRMLMLQFWAGIAAVLLLGHTAWSQSRGEGLAGFAREFADVLLGPSGLPLAYILAWAGITFVRHRKSAERRGRRWLKDEGHDGPVALSYRFEPGGLLVTAPRQRQAVACRRIVGVSETPGHFFIGVKDFDDVYPLPRHALADGDEARIRAWGASCHVGGPGRTTAFEGFAAETGGETALSARFTVTEADREAALAWQWNRPAMKRRARRVFAWAFVAFALLPPVVLCLGWLIDTDRVPLAYALPLLTDMLPGAFLYGTLPLWAMLSLLILAFPRIKRWEQRGYARHLQQRTQAYETEVRLSERGLESEQDGLVSVVDWSNFSGIERRGEHFLLLRREEQPLIMPLRALTDAEQAQFERIVTDRIEAARSEGAG